MRPREDDHGHGVFLRGDGDGSVARADQRAAVSEDAAGAEDDERRGGRRGVRGGVGDHRRLDALVREGSRDAVAAELGAALAHDELERALLVRLLQERLDDRVAAGGEYDAGGDDVLERLLRDVRDDGVELVDELADGFDHLRLETLHPQELRVLVREGVVREVTTTRGRAAPGGVAGGPHGLARRVLGLLAHDVKDAATHVADDEL